MVVQSDEFPFSIGELAAFLAICDTGSITAAARRLGVTQPAVSIALSELEARLGAPLVDRSVRPLQLRPAGVLLRQRASALLSEARQIAPMLREVTRGKLPLIRVGVVDSLGRALTARLARAAADIADEVAVFAGLTAAHATNLLTRNLDVMIGLDDLADVTGLERWPIFTEPYVLILSPGLAIPETVEALGALGALGGVRQFVRFSARSSTGVDIDRHLTRLGLDIPRRLEFDTPYGLASAVAAGDAFAVTTPLCLYESGIAPGEVVVAALPGPALGRRVTLVARKDEHRHAPRALAEAARDELGTGVAGALEGLAHGLSRSLKIAGPAQAGA